MTESALTKDARPKPFVVVLMPFAKSFDDVYEVGIREVCEKVGMHCERADKQIFEGTILERIYNQIAKADIIVADMTGQNPNVFYEAGYAHALGKRVILLTQKKEDIPFDLEHYPHIIYSNRIVDLRPELEKRLQWMADNPRDPLDRVDLNLAFHLGGLNIATEPEIPTSDDDIGPGTPMNFVLGVHNAGRRIVREGEVEIGIALARGAGEVTGHSGLFVKTGWLYMLGGVSRLFPDAWAEFRFAIDPKKRLRVGDRFPFDVRIFSELGSQSYSVHVAFYTAAEFEEKRQAYFSRIDTV